MAGVYVLKKSADGQFMFNLHASNGEVILTSERYEQKGSAEHGIESVRANSPFDERYERRSSVRDEPYFVLKAANGQVIGTSEIYSSQVAREAGIASVKLHGPSAPVRDET